MSEQTMKLVWEKLEEKIQRKRIYLFQGHKKTARKRENNLKMHKLFLTTVIICDIFSFVKRTQTGVLPVCAGLDRKDPAAGYFRGENSSPAV